MKVLIHPDKDSAVECATEIMAQGIKDKPNAVLGLATGGTVEIRTTMTHKEEKIRLNLPPFGCRNSFSSGSDGKAIRDDLHRKDRDGSSCGLVRRRRLPTCPSVPQGGHYWAANGSHF